MQDVPSLREHVRALTVVGKPCSKTEMTETTRIVTVLAQILPDKATQLCRDNADGACMIAYASDGWSGKIQSMTQAIAGDHLVDRRGKRHHELLLERAFVRVLRPDGQQAVQVLLDRPRGLSLGRTSWNMFSAAVEFVQDLRSIGCAGVAIQFYCMDKLHCGTVSRFLRGRHALQYKDGFSSLELDEPLEVLECLAWVVTMSCKAHGCSNAVVWALKAVGDENLVKDAHVSIASLRNSADCLHQKAGIFVQRYVDFVDRDYNRQDLIAFWSFLGISAAWIQLFADADPVWNGQRLQVASQFGRSPDVFAKLRLLVLYCLRWYNWSETRWPGVRKSATLYLRSLGIGVEAIAKLVYEDPTETTFHLNGQSKSTAAVRRYFCIAGVSAEPPELVLEGRGRDSAANPRGLARDLWVPRLVVGPVGGRRRRRLHRCRHPARVHPERLRRCRLLGGRLVLGLAQAAFQPHPGRCQRDSPGCINFITSCRRRSERHSSLASTRPGLSKGSFSCERRPRR